MTYVVQMFYHDDRLGEFWDDVSLDYATRKLALQALATREGWLTDDGDYDTEAKLRVHCYRAPRAPKPIFPRRLIASPAPVYAPELRKKESSP